MNGMKCGGCVKSVTNVLQELPGVARAEVSLERGEAPHRVRPGQAGDRRHETGHQRRRLRGALIRPSVSQ
ncbi:MAG: heavy-metal-associated domain-containing protein [Comamonadaceae bacterium]|nr:heavy-metal-associated domain-containing protein [Comamonadaceae bacterium]